MPVFQGDVFELIQIYIKQVLMTGQGVSAYEMEPQIGKVFLGVAATVKADCYFCRINAELCQLLFNAATNTGNSALSLALPS